MTRMFLVFLLALQLTAVANLGFCAEEKPVEPPLEMSEEDREIAEMLELLELLELLNDMENVAVLEENQ